MLPRSPPTVFVTVAVVTAPSYTLVATPASLSIPRGHAGDTTLSLNPVGGYSGTVMLSCSNLPANVVCWFAKNSIQLSGNQPVNVGLSIETSVQQTRIEAIPKPTQSPLSPVLPR
jgi:hypothetical protein